MTEEITGIATPEQIENELEEQREDIKTKLGLDDEAFDILIKDTILASYAELSIRIKPDDPIFAVILSQKKVMNYYTKIIAEALKVTPREIGNIINQKADEFKELAATFGTLIDEFHDEFLADLQNKSLEINNSIIAAFDKFVDKKIEEIKKAVSSIEAKPAITQTNDKQTHFIFLLLIMILAIVNIGLTGFIAFGKSADKSKEIQYQKGLIEGFQDVRKELTARDADKVERIIIQAIDKQLQGK